MNESLTWKALQSVTVLVHCEDLADLDNIGQAFIQHNSLYMYCVFCHVEFEGVLYKSVLRNSTTSYKQLENQKSMKNSQSFQTPP